MVSKTNKFFNQKPNSDPIFLRFTVKNQFNDFFKPNPLIEIRLTSAFSIKSLGYINCY